MLFSRHNVNDNHVGHVLYKNKTDHLAYVPGARYLIENYVSAYWKNDPNDMDFIQMELTLCGYLHDLALVPVARDRIVKWMARVLGINPVLLHNDPDLPF